MQTPSPHWTETLTGLGATGVEVVLAWVGPGRPMLPGHPLIPVLQVGEATSETADLDLTLTGDSNHWSHHLLNHLLNTLSRRYLPAANRQANVDFQITRGLLGVSL